MQIRWIVGVFLSFIKLAISKLSFFFFQTSVTRLSKYSNFPRIDKIVSIEDNEILPVMKWVRILDCDDPSLIAPIVK
jgi:hypothetical protein